MDSMDFLNRFSIDVAKGVQMDGFNGFFEPSFDLRRQMDDAEIFCERRFFSMPLSK